MFINHSHLPPPIKKKDKKFKKKSKKFKKASGQCRDMCSAWMVRGDDDDSASHGSVSAFHGRILKVVQSTMVCLSLSAGWESLLIYRESHRSPRPATVSQHDNIERWHRVVLLFTIVCNVMRGDPSLTDMPRDS